MRLFLIVIGLLIFLPHQYSWGQANDSKSDFTFMFYNTENFFDCENDSLTNDDEFTSTGDRRWNPGRLYAKAERLGKVIIAAGKWNPPVFVGLCEIENLQVLEKLTGIAPLNKYLYKIVQKDSPDERGIDVAFIYRPDLFKPIDYEPIPVVDPDDRSFRTRDILRISGVLNKCDTLHVFINHWPSRYGGIMETMKYRSLAAQTLKESVKTIFTKFRDAKIICMGDFNDGPRDESIASVFEAKATDNPEIKGEMIDLSCGWLSDPVQTIKSQYNWESFDQWMVSDYFLENKGCTKFLKAEVFKAAFLMEPDVKYGGVKPKRTYVGFKYQEGFSDHLPVLLKFEMQNH